MPTVCSNSLTECLVFGARAAEHAVDAIKSGVSDGNEQSLKSQAEAEAGRIEALRGSSRGGEQIAQVRRDINSTMETGCGVYREQASMQATVEDLKAIRPRAQSLALQDSSKVFNTELIAALELENMVDVAEAVANSALPRKESRGAHTCKDFPTRDDQNYLHHTMCTYNEGGAPTIEKGEVTLGTWVPEERKY